MSVTTAKRSTPTATAQPPKVWSVWRAIAAALAAGALAASGLAIATYTNPCQAEGDDSQVVCYWDASERGNHLGTNFVNVGYGRFIIHLG